MGTALGLLGAQGHPSLAVRRVCVQFLGPGQLLHLLEELLEGHLLRLPKVEVVPDLAHQHLFEGHLLIGFVQLVVLSMTRQPVNLLLPELDGLRYVFLLGGLLGVH